jgi:E3 ubiquitin-protein ligase UBR7
MAQSSAASAARLGGLRKCSLNPAPDQPYLANDNNLYTHNFSGRFCRCGRDYDPVTEPEAMVHCIGCEVSV